MAGLIHFGGVIFYGLFASGELQPWAEPPREPEQLQMQQQYLPTIGPGGQTQLGPGGQAQFQDQTQGWPASDGGLTKGTNPFDPSSDPWGDQNGTVQSGLTNSYQPNYGATESQQQYTYETRPYYVQQPPTDRYMHGTIEDREY